MIGALLYMASLVWVPHIAVLAVFPVLLWRLRQNGALPKPLHSLQLRASAEMWALLTLAVYTSLLQWANATPNDWTSWVPYGGLLLLTAAVGKWLNRLDMRFLVAMILAECLLAGAQWAVLKTQGGDALMYSLRVDGLSGNSSNLALKALLALLLLPRTDWKQGARYLAYAAVGLGLLATFNRTALLAAGAYFAFSTVRILSDASLSKATYRRMLALALTGIAAAAVVVLLKGDAIWNQLTRGRGVVEMAGRSFYWKHAIEWTAGNPWLGNGGQKWDYAGAHAHNSYLQMAARNGLPIVLLWVGIAARFVRRANAAEVLTIGVYSLFQFGWGWGISMMDVALWHSLFSAVPIRSAVCLVKQSQEKGQSQSEYSANSSG